MRNGMGILLGMGTLMVLAALVVSHGGATGANDYEVRTIDGSENNLRYPEYGSVGVPLLRKADVGYEDSVEAPAGEYRSSTRLISNILAAQGEESIPNRAGVSDFFWQWGQFIDHDLDLTPAAYPIEPFYVSVPTADLYFDPYSEGEKYIVMNRSIHDEGSTRRSPRQQLNLITAFIDASNVYGSDQDRADALRTFEGGKLKTSGGGQFLPFNADGLDNAGGPDPKLFLAGDVRANEQIALTAVHTLFVREHNRLCEEIAAAQSTQTDEQIYQRARKIVGAQLQVITYQEFLPLLLGPEALPPYRGYDPDLNPGIANEFSTVAYRFGHSMLSPTLLRVNSADQELVETSLKDAFFNPLLVHKGGGISSILHGLATQVAQEVDTRVVDGIRNFLFGEPGEGGFDLASLNMQRGRDHGIDDYNSLRKAYRLKPVRRFSDIVSDPQVQELLQSAYGSTRDMDPWIVGLAEDHMPGALVGETFRTIMVEQFIRLRDGDRFWYLNDPFFTSEPDSLAELEQTRLSDIVRRNTKLGDELQDNAFIAQ